MEKFSWIVATQITEKPHLRPYRMTSAPAQPTGDPSIISLSLGEMRRLVDIETSARMALDAMSAIALPNKDVTDAAHALADALASPALHGG